ncbi:LLM class flavin-dependent oxidoreductase [Amycolatopsis sp. NPDC089917]|uniref:LLM class flavin-dependent oxidoreductase n=1 Tax=Amycolatopsis sp. NPDC089917 TaxID=3155187 RepID=UPI00343D42FC
MTSRTAGGPVRLAVELDGDGSHPAAGLGDERPPAERLSPRALVGLVLAAEIAGFALVTFDDSPLPPPNGFRPEALGRAAYVATRTNRIGLGATAHVTTTEPFHVATQLASLDHASHGRAAWLVGAANSPDALATIGTGPLEPAGLSREVTDVVDVVRRLWDSWEDDAVIKDAATGRYLDPGKVHHVDFEGAAFSIKGPLITPRPPQGLPVVIAPERLLEAARPDVVLIGGSGLDDLRRRAHHAKESGTPRVFAEVEVLLNAAETAEKRLRRLDSSIRWEHTERLRYTGSTDGLTDLLAWLGTVVDGVRLHPAVVATDLPPLLETVLPRLRAQRALSVPEPGTTLRAALGLPRPANRFAASKG